MKPDYKYDYKSESGSIAAQKDTTFQEAQTPEPLSNASHGKGHEAAPHKKGKK